MRSYLLTMTAGAGLALILLGTSPASSITLTAPSGARQATDPLDVIEAVHCRRYSHRHRKGHRWGRGCAVKGTATGPARAGAIAPRRSITTPLRPLSPAGRAPGNFYNPSNPQDRSGSSNPQGMTQPRAINPQDMR
jgi:hypothetical protein